MRTVRVSGCTNRWFVRCRYWYFPLSHCFPWYFGISATAPILHETPSPRTRTHWRHPHTPSTDRTATTMSFLYNWMFNVLKSVSHTLPSSRVREFHLPPPQHQE